MAETLLTLQVANGTRAITYESEHLTNLTYESYQKVSLAEKQESSKEYVFAYK